MSKTIKGQFEKKLTLEKLYEAFYRASKGKWYKQEILKYERNLEINLSNLLHRLKTGTYKCGQYREFYIYEPKERLIRSLPFKDRIVHQWYVEEFIKPYFIPRFINTTYACLVNRGMHKSVFDVQRAFKKMKNKYSDFYVLKGDIHKYFYSIDKNILFNIMRKYITDKKLLNLTEELIFDDISNVGIPIGNFTSQYFANIYLNEFDQYVKKQLHVKYYFRYMDDFVLLLESKEQAKELLKNIEEYLLNNLNLKLNPKTRYYPNKFGVNFCGYIIFSNYKLLRKRCVNKLKRLNKIGKLNINNFKGHLIHANSHNLIRLLMSDDFDVEKFLLK